MKKLVTGGAGFIGSAVIRALIAQGGDRVVNVDKLTYAGDLRTLSEVAGSEHYVFEQVDICDRAAINRLFCEHKPDAVMHLAAESHVDRSIDGPAIFIETNIVGTSILLEEALGYWKALTGEKKDAFRFLHVSTDEVYGALGEEGLFSETSPYDPSSPYSASKASSDHLVRAWGRTFGLPVLVSNCSNNYGPFQHPEKLIPTVLKTALSGKPIPVYGKGENVRDWLYVEDHARALLCILRNGLPGESYNVGGNNEHANLDVVQRICHLLDGIEPSDSGQSYDTQIEFVTDRPGHDWRYAIDASKIKRDLGWEPRESFETGLEKTVLWYLDHRSWWQAGKTETDRLGLGRKASA